MESLRSFARRSVDDSFGSDASMVNLMIALLVLVFFALLSVSLLLLFRRQRRQREMLSDSLPQYDVKRSSNHRRLTIQTGSGPGRSSVIVFKDGQPMLANPQSPPHSPDNVPEIHITFPDEQDDQGRPKSGRVLVVRLGETTIGLEPRKEEQLPAYEKESKTEFYTLDMDKIGGLKEKEYC